MPWLAPSAPCLLRRWHGKSTTDSLARGSKMTSNGRFSSQPTQWKTRNPLRTQQWVACPTLWTFFPPRKSRRQWWFVARAEVERRQQPGRLWKARRGLWLQHLTARVNWVKSLLVPSPSLWSYTQTSKWTTPRLWWMRWNSPNAIIVGFYKNIFSFHL